MTALKQVDKKRDEKEENGDLNSECFWFNRDVRGFDQQEMFQISHHHPNRGHGFMACKYDAPSRTLQAFEIPKFVKDYSRRVRSETYHLSNFVKTHQYR